MSLMSQIPNQIGDMLYDDGGYVCAKTATSEACKDMLKRANANQRAIIFGNRDAQCIRKV